MSNKCPNFNSLSKNVISALTYIDGNNGVDESQKKAANEMIQFMANWCLDLNVVHLKPDEIIVDKTAITDLLNGNLESQKL